MKVKKLTIPVRLHGKTYSYHIDLMYFGQTEREALVLYRTFQALEEGEGGVLGKFLAKTLNYHARMGSIFLAADQSAKVTEGCAGVWNYEDRLIRVQKLQKTLVKNKTEFVIKNIKVYDGRNIRIATGQHSIEELVANLGHEATHHIVLANNHSISARNYTADPTFYSQRYLQHFQQAFPEDMINIGNIGDPKMQQYAEYVFGRPDVYIKDVPFLQQQINHLSAKVVTGTISKRELGQLHHAKTELLNKPKLYRAEIAACLVEAEIRMPGALRIIAPKTSQVLYECLFNHSSIQDVAFVSNRTHGIAGRILFSPSNRSFQPDLNDIIMPTTVARDRFIPIYSSELSNHRWQYHPTADGIVFNKLRPKPLFSPAVVTNYNDIVNFAKKRGLVDIEADLVDEHFFWKCRRITPTYNDELTDLFKKNYSLLESSKIGTKFALPFSKNTLLSVANKSVVPGLGIGLNLFSSWYQDPNSNWFAHGLTKFGVDSLVYAPLAFVPGSTPVFISSAIEQPLASYVDFCRENVNHWSAQESGLYNNFMLRKWQWELANASTLHGVCAAINIVTKPILEPLEHLSDALVHSFLTGFKDVDDYINDVRATLGVDDDRHESLDDIQIAYAPYKYLYNWLVAGSNKTIPANVSNVGSGMNSPPITLSTNKTGDNGSSLIAPQLQPTTITKSTASQPQIVQNAAVAVGQALSFAKLLPQRSNNPALCMPDFSFKLQPTNETPSGLCNFQSLKPTFSLLNQAAKNDYADPVVPVAEAGKVILEGKDQQPVIIMEAGSIPPNFEQLLESNLPVKIELESINIGTTPDGHAGFNAHFTGGATFSAGIKISIGSGVTYACFTMNMSIPLGEQFFEKLAVVTGQMLPFAVAATVVIAGGMFLYQNYWKHKIKRTIRHLKKHVAATNEDLEDFQRVLDAGADFIQQLYFDPKCLTDVSSFEGLLTFASKDILKDIKHRQDYAYDHDGFAAHYGQINGEQALSQACLDLKAEIKLAKLYHAIRTVVQEKYKNESIRILLDRIVELNNKRILTPEEAAELTVLRDLCIRKCLGSNRELLVKNPFLFNKNLGNCYKLNSIEIKKPFRPREKKGHGHRTEKANKAAAVMGELKKAYDKFTGCVEAAGSVDEIREAKNNFMAKFTEAEQFLRGIELKGVKWLTAYYYYYGNLQEMRSNVLSTWRSIKAPGNSDNKAPKLNFPSMFNLSLTKVANDFIVEHRKKTPNEIKTLAKELTKKVIKQGHLDGLNFLVTDNVCSLLRENKFDEAENFLKDINPIEYKVKGHKDKAPLINPENSAQAQAAINYCRQYQNESVKFWANLCEPITEETKSEDNTNITSSGYVQDYARNATLFGTFNDIAGLTPKGMLAYAKAVDITIKPEGLKCIFEAIKIRAIDMLPVILLSKEDPKQFLKDLVAISPDIIDPKLQKGLEEAIDFCVDHKKEPKQFWIEILKTSTKKENLSSEKVEEGPPLDIHQVARLQVYTMTQEELFALSLHQLIEQVHKYNTAKGEQLLLEEKKAIVDVIIMTAFNLYQSDPQGAKIYVRAMARAATEFVDKNMERLLLSSVDYFIAHSDKGEDFWKERVNNPQKLFEEIKSPPQSPETPKEPTQAKEEESANDSNVISNHCILSIAQGLLYKAYLKKINTLDNDQFIKVVQEGGSREENKDNRALENSAVHQIFVNRIGTLLVTNPKGIPDYLAKISAGKIKEIDAEGKEIESPLIEVSFLRGIAEIGKYFALNEEDRIHFLFGIIADPTSLDKVLTGTAEEKQKIIDFVEGELIQQGPALCQYLGALGFHGKAAFYLKILLSKEAKKEKPNQDVLAKLEYDSKDEDFKHQGQLIGPVVDAVLNLFKREIANTRFACLPHHFTHGTSPQITKAINVASGLVQMLLTPTLAIQGVHQCLVGDPKIFLRGVKSSAQQLFDSFNNPKSFSAILLHMRFSLTFWEHLPVERLIPDSLSSLKSCLALERQRFLQLMPDVLKYSNIFNTFLSLVTLPESAETPNNISKLIVQGFDEIFNRKNREGKNKGTAMVDPKKLFLQDFIKSFTDNIGNIISGLVQTSLIGRGLVMITVPSKIGIDLFSLLRWGVNDSRFGALSNAVSNHIFHSNALLKNPADKKLHTNATRFNFIKIEQLLKQHFRGLAYNYTATDAQEKQLNQIRLYHLQVQIQEACAHQDCKKQVLDLSEKLEFDQTIRGKKITIKAINAIHQIPAHLAWETVKSRLIILSASLDGILNFRQEYNRYAECVIEEGKKDLEWQKEHLASVIKAYQEIVKFALEAMVYKVFNVSKNEERRDYFESLTGQYQLCRWQDLIDNHSKFLLALLAYESNLLHHCQLFFKEVDFLQLKIETLPTGTISLLHKIGSNDACAMQMLSTLLANDQKVYEEIIKLINEQKISEVGSVLALVPRDFPGKRFAKATLNYYLSNNENFGATLQLLVTESKQDLSYWTLLLNLMLQTQNAIYFVESNQKQMSCFVMVFGLQRVAAEGIKNLHLSEGLMLSPQSEAELDKIIKGANDQLVHYLSSVVTGNSSPKYQDQIMTEILCDIKKDIHIPAAFVVKVTKLLSDLTYKKIPGICYLPLALNAQDSLFISLNKAMENENDGAQKNSINQIALSLKKNIKIVKVIEDALSLEVETSYQEFPPITILHKECETTKDNKVGHRFAKLTEIALSPIERIAVKKRPSSVCKQDEQRVRKNTLEFQKLQTQELTLAMAIKTKAASTLTDAEMHYQVALFYLEKGYAGLGHSRLTQAVALDPTHRDALYQLCYLEQKRQDSKKRERLKHACEYLEKAVKAKDDEFKVLYKREYLEALYSWGNFEKQHYQVTLWQPTTIVQADTLYIECREKYLTYRVICPDGYCSEGHIFYANLEFTYTPPVAMEILSLLLPKILKSTSSRSHTRDIDKAYSLFKIAADQGHYPSKTELLLREQEKSTAVQWQQLGLNYFHEKNGNDALLNSRLASFCFGEAIKKDKNNKEALYGMGLNLLTTGEHDQAMAYFERADLNGHESAKERVLSDKYKNNTPEQWFFLGEYYRKEQSANKDLYKALLCYRYAISKKKDYEEAESKYFWLNNPNLTADHWFSRGVDVQKALNFKEARLCYLIAQEIFPTHGKALYALANLYELGLGLSDKDLVKSEHFYARAENAGNSEAKRKHIVLLVKREHNNIVDSVGWRNLGHNYYFVQHDYYRALACLEFAVYLKEDGYALYLLGWMYTHGIVVSKDLLTGKSFYERSAKQGEYEAKAQLLPMYHTDHKTADEWYKIGESYYLGSEYKGMRYPVDNHYARACFLQAIAVLPKRYHFDALMKLANIYDNAYGVEQNLNKTKEYLEAALLQTKDLSATDYLSRVKLRLQNPLMKTASEWVTVGDNLYFGKNGITKNLFWSRIAFEHANLLDAKNTHALYTLGWMHQHGEGDLAANLVMSEQYYKLAAKEGSTSAQIELLKSPRLKDAYDWWTLGAQYSYDKEIFQAQACYEQALIIDPNYSKAVFALGNLFENFKSNGLITAAKYYLRYQTLEPNWKHANLERIFNLPNATAWDLNAIGEMHQYGETPDFCEALKWYEQAKAKGSPQAYRNIGKLYESGTYAKIIATTPEGYNIAIERNVVKAANHFQLALTKGCLEAKQSLDSLLISPEITGEDLNTIGAMYSNGTDGVVVDLTQAAKWFEQAKNKDYAAAFRNIGYFYAHGYCYSQDFTSAARHYFISNNKGYDANKDFQEMLNRSDITIEQLEQLATMLRGYNATSLVMVCEEKIRARRELLAAPRNIGYLYEIGTNRYPQNFLFAAKHYQQSLEKGYHQAQDDLDRIFTGAATTNDTLNNIGMMYHNADGKEGISQNYGQAARWYEHAKTKGSSVAYRNLGVLYEFGNHYPLSLLAATTCYHQSLKLGNQAAETDLKRIAEKTGKINDEIKEPKKEIAVPVVKEKPEPLKPLIAPLINQLGILAKPKAKPCTKKITVEALGIVVVPNNYTVGNCLFDAFAALNPGQSSAYYRKIAVDFIRNNNDIKQAIQTDIDNNIDNFIIISDHNNIRYRSVEEYISTMSLDRAWGSHYEMLSLAKQLQRPVIYFKLSNKVSELNTIVNISIENDCDTEPLILEWSGNHYRPFKLQSGKNWQVFMQQIRDHIAAPKEARRVAFAF